MSKKSYRYSHTVTFCTHNGLTKRSLFDFCSRFVSRRIVFVLMSRDKRELSDKRQRERWSGGKRSSERMPRLILICTLRVSLVTRVCIRTHTISNHSIWINMLTWTVIVYFLIPYKIFDFDMCSQLASSKKHPYICTERRYEYVSNKSTC